MSAIFSLQVDSDEFNISLIKSNEENKTIEIKDLKIFTRYSVVITAFTGNVSAAYVEGKSSAEVIVTTLESGKTYFSSLLKTDLVR